MKPSRSLLWATICVGVLVPMPSRAVSDPSPTDSIDIADVCVQVELVRAELEVIRFVMGRPTNEQPEMAVSGVATREVYAQALTLFRKAERLGFEQTREHAPEPAAPTGEITSADVYRVVQSALERIRRVKEHLGIEQQIQPPPRDPSKTATEVFRAVVQANRQLNLLLDRRFAPSDVFEQVTRGVGYASRLLEHFPDATLLPDPPEFEIGKRPGDVYRRLLDCFDRVRAIAKASGLEMLELEADETRIMAAEPSDVYDIASLLVSELAFLHSEVADARAPRPVYYVGRKFPSHVYQRAGILELQLVELEQWVQQNPDWLAE